MMDMFSALTFFKQFLMILAIVFVVGMPLAALIWGSLRFVVVILVWAVDRFTRVRL